MDSWQQFTELSHNTKMQLVNFTYVVGSAFLRMLFHEHKDTETWY
jgi:hypothetical protein